MTIIGIIQRAIFYMRRRNSQPLRFPPRWKFELLNDGSVAEASQPMRYRDRLRTWASSSPPTNLDTRPVSETTKRAKREQHQPHLTV